MLLLWVSQCEMCICIGETQLRAPIPKRHYCHTLYYVMLKRDVCPTTTSHVQRRFIEPKESTGEFNTTSVLILMRLPQFHAHSYSF